MPSCAVRQSDNRKRVVVAGLGDTGVLTAIHLSRHADVVGISVKPALVSGQELRHSSLCGDAPIQVADV